MTDNLVNEVAAELRNWLIRDHDRQAADRYDTDRMAADLVRYVDEHRAPGRYTALGFIEAAGTDFVAARFNAYLREKPYGVPIEPEALSVAKRKAKLRAEIDGVDFDENTVTVPSRRAGAPVAHTGPLPGFPSAFERAEAEMQRLRDAGHDL